ncbi:aminoglycoside phosphotransferase family protein [Nocardioides sp. MAHUQ-72]|uniref:aminoglycoside phosphotransferase family protein n=1 Tax=unclassified Nocardioides TaxID=2615069 RepID=UPI0036101689
MSPHPQLPPGVLAFAERGPDWAGFVDRLPGLVREILGEWELVPDGAPTHGFCALVLPVLAAGEPAVLKIGFPDDESEHEHLALQRWGGNGAVRLLRADPRRRALLLERLDTADLADAWDLDACEVVAGLYSRLHVPAPPQLRALTSYVERWNAGLAELPRNAPVPRRLVEQALALGRDLVADPASTGTMIHADLHYANVLASDRDGWLAIDPKPVSGDPHYEPAPMLWNRWDEVTAAPSVRAAVRSRFHALVDGAMLDEDRARAWVVVRMLHNASWRLADPPGAERQMSDDDFLTMCIAIAKAVQD